MTMSEKCRTVKDFDPSEQPREKALAHGCKVLSVAELWAIILRVGMQGIPITELCRSLMKEAGGSMRNLERFERERLLAIPGLGPAKVLQVEAVLELIRRFNLEPYNERPQITSSSVIFSLIEPMIGNLDHEEIWCLFLDRQNRMTEMKQFTIGSSVASIFDVKSIVRHAILVKAEGIVMCHNHPSGNNRPSIQDDNITRSLSEACKLLDLRLIDHVIVTAHKEKRYSYYDEGRL